MEDMVLIYTHSENIFIKNLQTTYVIHISHLWDNLRKM
jgi:hypothetical protein